MLTQLHIRNLAVVSSLTLDLTPGMSVITGETGAGKSILVDALGLALGDRTDPGMIRAGCAQAEISAAFDPAASPEAAAWLRDHSFESDGECILRRVLVREGRSRGFVNGSPAPLQLLQELGERLVDIHGQHAHQSLLRRDHQRRLLDAYAGQQVLAQRVAQLYRDLRAKQAQLGELQRAERDQASRLDLLRFQAEELQALSLADGELEQLDEDLRRLSNADRLLESCSELVRTLYESEGSVQETLSRGCSNLDELLGADSRLAEYRDLLVGAEIQVHEAAAGLKGYLDGLDADPEQLQRTEERLGVIHDLARKHRVSPQDLPQRLQDIGSELAQLECADARTEALAGEVRRLREEFLGRAKELGALRRSAARELERKVSEHMQQLGMAGGRFAIEIETRTEEEAAAGGLEDVAFLVSANPGQPLQPLVKVASGGELSRISLAIQVVTAGCGGVPTLIFDEVDVGIGGAVAEIVGALLRRLGTERQVLCVTHLPQVAAQGHQHLRVQKTSSERSTQTSIQTLRPDERISEIARMLGGLEINSKTLAHAEDMIAHASRQPAGAEP